MKTFFALACCLLLNKAFSQQLTTSQNTALGFQEFPTTVEGHAADSRGNQYFTGYFRGQLTINGQVVTQGNGLEDVFWAKTSSTGQLIAHRKFGSPNTEATYSDALAIDSNDRMVFGMRFHEPIDFGTTTVQPYIPATGVGFATCLVAIDTNGTVQWVRRTNLQNFRLVAAGNVFHAIGTVTPNSPATKVEEQVVLDSLGNSGIIDLMFDHKGVFLGVKKILSRQAGQFLFLSSVQGFSNGNLLYSFRAVGDTNFVLNNSVVTLPSNNSNYHVLINTDTAYSRFRVKVLNPQGQGFGGAIGTSIPFAIGSQDSIYTVCNTEHTTPFVIDGFALQPQTNTLLVLDSSLVVRRRAIIGSSFAGHYPAHMMKRRVFFKNIGIHNNQLYFIGQYSGINESPINTITPKDTVITVMPGVSVTVDQNGYSREFIAKTDMNIVGSSLRWFGDHRPYENLALTTRFLHPAGPGRFCFLLTADNNWNPFLFDANLNVSSGTTQRNADQPEVPQMIQYFNDGGRLVLGYARGKTALDSAGSSFTCNTMRRDVFVAKLNAASQVVWYKRWHCTLPQAEIKGLEVNGNRAFFLVNYTASQNDSDYLRVDNKVYPVKGSASLMASVDEAGTIKIYNLLDPLLRNFELRQFNFFRNGDLLLTNSPDMTPVPNFPGLGQGVYFFRIDPGNGSTVSMRKLSGAGLPTIHSLRVDKNDRIYLSALIPSSPGSLSLYGPGSKLDSLQVPAQPQLAHGLIKLDWNKLYWLKRMSNYWYPTQSRFTGDLQLLNNSPVLSHPVINNSVVWDGQTILPVQAGANTALIVLDSNGKMVTTKVIRNLLPFFTRKGHGEEMYLSSATAFPLQVDTISIGNAGFSDGIGLVFDSALRAKRSFRIGSPFGEALQDMDIYKDSLVALAYSGQTSPQFYTNRTAVSPGDYQQDAYLGILVLKSGTVTNINTPLPPQHKLAIVPNPIADKTLKLQVSVPEPLLSLCTVYGAAGQQVFTTAITLTPGTKHYNLYLPPSAGKGVYRIVIANKRWTATRSFLVL